MRSRLFSLALAALVFAAPPAALAQEAQPGDSCAGFGAGHFMRSGGPEIPGGHFMVCDGANWISVLDYADTGHALMQVDHDPGSCTALKQGRLRYTSAGDLWQYCDGTGWTDLASGSGSGTPAGTGANGFWELQYNSGGSFAADSDLVFTSTGRIYLGDTSDPLPGKLTVTVTDTDSGIVTIKGTSWKTTGSSFGVAGTAAGVGADINFGLYGWASGATTNNLGLFVDSGDAVIGGSAWVAAGAKLDVRGSIKIAYGGEACDANRKGAIYYNSATDKFMGCATAGSWTELGSGSGLWFQSGSDIYYNGGFVGIGASTPKDSLNKFRVYGTDTGTASGAYSLAHSYLLVDPGANQNTARITRGIESFAEVPGSNTNVIGAVRGVAGVVGNYGTGNVEELTGIVGFVDNGAAANVANMKGGYSTATVSAGAVTNVYGHSIYSGVTGGTVTQHRGMEIWLDQSGGGTVANRYALFLGKTGTATTNDYGVYQTGYPNNYFAGKIGIGFASSPSSLLDLRENTGNAIITLGDVGTNLSQNLSLGRLRWFNTDTTNDGPNEIAAVNAFTANANGSGGYLALSTHDGTEGGEGSAPVERMRIDPSGNVGIGTSAPVAKVHAYSNPGFGNIAVEGDDSSGAALTVFTKGDGATHHTQASTNAWRWVGYGNTYSTTAYQNDFVVEFWEGATRHEPVYIDSLTRNFGINTNTPQTRLQVGGTLRIDYGGESCDAAREGAIHYNSSTDKFMGCATAGSWTALGSGALAIDDLSDAITQYSSSSMYLGQGTGVNSTGSGNTFVGKSAGPVNTTGGGNTIMGSSAGLTLATGSNNILIGHDVDAPASWISNYLNIGNAIYGDLSVGRISFAKGSDITGIVTDTIAGWTNGFPVDDAALFVPLTNGGNSDLRLYITDDAGDSFSIWGDTCGGGVCNDLNSASVVAYFQAGGNVGIGTNAPKTKLDVNGTIKMAYGGEACDANREGAIHYNSSTDKFMACTTAGSWIEISTGTVASSFAAGTVGAPGWAVTTDPDTGLYAPAANTLSISAGGKESIRLNTATNAVNYLAVTPAATGAAPALAAAGSDTNIGLTLATKGTGVLNLMTAGAGALNFNTNNSATNTQLVVSHTASAVNRMQVTGAATGNAPVLSAVGSNANIGLTLTPKGTGVVSVTGDLQYTGVLTAVSDIRLKDNIRAIDNPLLKLTSLHGLYYDKKSGEDNKAAEYGFAAQEVQKIFPELVRTAPDEMGTLSVNYIGLIAPMVEALKEQQAQIEGQQAYIRKTDDRMRALERQNETLLRRLETLETGRAE